MSKIGKKAIDIPSGVEIKITDGNLEAKGPKGTLVLSINPKAKAEISDNRIVINKSRNSREASAIWGLTRALVKNIIIGVSEGYEKKLELQGVGFRMSVAGKKLAMALGFSHPVEVIIPDNLTVKVEENNILSISGINKQEVGQFAADVRALKKPEPYKGKGFRYVGEQVRKKVGKKAATTK